MDSWTARRLGGDNAEGRLPGSCRARAGPPGLQVSGSGVKSESESGTRVVGPRIRVDEAWSGRRRDRQLGSAPELCSPLGDQALASNHVRKIMHTATGFDPLSLQPFLSVSHCLPFCVC